MSLRKITDQQFSQGTTIDGDRIEDAIQSLEGYINEVDGGSIRTRWIPQTIHLGYLPNTTAADSRITGSVAAYHTPMTPWLPVCNKGANDSRTVTNQFRLKGTRLPYFPAIPYNADYVSPNFLADSSNQIVWSTSYAFSTPVILDALNVTLLTDGTTFTQTFQYGSGGTAPPSPRAASDSVKDIQILVSLDNPFTPEDQATHNKIYHKREFSAEAWLQREVAAAPTADMLPGLKSTVTYRPNMSFIFNETDMKIPIPIDARLRFSIVLPLWDYARDATLGVPWYNKPQKFVPSLSLTVLEPMLYA